VALIRRLRIGGQRHAPRSDARDTLCCGVGEAPPAGGSIARAFSVGSSRRRNQHDRSKRRMRRPSGTQSAKPSSSSHATVKPPCSAAARLSGCGSCHERDLQHVAVGIRGRTVVDHCPRQNDSADDRRGRTTPGHGRAVIPFAHRSTNPGCSTPSHSKAALHRPHDEVGLVERERLLALAHDLDEHALIVGRHRDVLVEHRQRETGRVEAWPEVGARSRHDDANRAATLDGAHGYARPSAPATGSRVHGDDDRIGRRVQSPLCVLEPVARERADDHLAGVERVRQQCSFEQARHACRARRFAEERLATGDEPVRPENLVIRDGIDQAAEESRASMALCHEAGLPIRMAVAMVSGFRTGSPMTNGAAPAGLESPHTRPAVARPSSAYSI